MSEFTLQEKREFAKEMRRQPTLAERALWFHLQNGKMGHRFHRQSLQWGFILDFYCPSLRLGIEVDGSIHELQGQAERDEVKERALESYRVTLLRFSNEDVLSYISVVLYKIREECNALAALKALRWIGISETNTPLRNSRTCESVEKASASTPANTSAVDAQGHIPATAEDYAAINAAWEKLVSCSRQRSMPFTHARLTTAAERAFEQRMRFGFWSQKKSNASALTETEPESLVVSNGMHVVDAGRRKA